MTTCRWVRKGSAVSYYKNDLKVEDQRRERYHYSLSFTYTADHDQDVVYLAHCYPYTYTDLQNYLEELKADPERSQYCRHRALCRTLAGNICDLLTITKYGVGEKVMSSRKGIVITARIHPGETNASWMMKGFLDFLTGPSEDAEVQDTGLI